MLSSKVLLKDVAKIERHDQRKASRLPEFVELVHMSPISLGFMGVISMVIGVKSGYISQIHLDFSDAPNVTPVPFRCACNEADIGEEKILQFVLGKE